MRDLQRMRGFTGDRLFSASMALISLAMLFAPGDCQSAIGLEPYQPRFGFGDAWSVAVAGTGVALDIGLVGGYRNPAGYLMDRNEIHGEGSAWGTFSIQNRVAPHDISFGAGTIGYLTRFASSNLALFYQSRSQIDRGASYGESRVIDSQNLAEIGIGWSFLVTETLAGGVTLATLRGSGYTGILLASSDLDTVSLPHLYLMRLGLQERSGEWRYGIVLESPLIGSHTYERPVNIARKRAEEVFSYRGAWSVQAGMGRQSQEGQGFEMDMIVTNSGFARLGDNPIAHREWSFSAGVAGRFRVDENLRLASGVRWTMSEPADRPALILGAGGEYTLGPQLLLFGSAGLYLPTSEQDRNTALDDVRPWIARAGVLFHEKLQPSK